VEAVLIQAGQDRVISPAEINTYPPGVKRIVLPGAHHMIPANAGFSQELVGRLYELTARAEEGTAGANL